MCTKTDTKFALSHTYKKNYECSSCDFCCEFYYPVKHDSRFALHMLKRCRIIIALIFIILKQVFSGCYICKRKVFL